MNNESRKVMYLDQMAWIHLTDREDLSGLKGRLIEEVERNKLVIPISSGNIIETMRLSNRDRRSQIAKTMMDLSKGKTIAPEYYLVPFEIDRALALTFNKPVPPLPNPLGVGVKYAFGNLYVPRDKLPGNNQEIEVVNMILDSPEGLNAMIIGPPFEIPIDVSDNFLVGVQESAKEADGAREIIKPYSAQMRKRGYAAVLAQILDKEIRESLEKLDIRYDDLIGLGQKKLMKFFSDIPCLDVEIELGSQRNGFWNRPVDPNDYVDICSLCVAIPYCDAIITEGFWIDLAKRSKLDQKYSVHLSKDVRSLLEII